MPTRTPMQLRRARIRRAVAAGAASLFLAIWGTVFVQLRAGHDPALSTTAASAQTTGAASSSTDQSTQSTSLAPATTSQS